MQHHISPVHFCQPRHLQLVIVDDDPSMVQLLETVAVSHLALEVDTVGFTSSVDAARWIEEHSVDLLFSDLLMPDIDGLELVRRAKRRNSWVQAVVLTGHSSWPRVEQANDAEACEFLLKPLDLDEFVAVLDQARDRFRRWSAAVQKTLHARHSPTIPMGTSSMNAPPRVSH